MNRTRIKDNIDLETTKDDFSSSKPTEKEGGSQNKNKKNSNEQKDIVTKTSKNALFKKNFTVISEDEDNTNPKINHQEETEEERKNSKFKVVDPRCEDKALDSVFDRIENKMERESAKEWRDYLKKNRSIIVDLFQVKKNYFIT